MIEPAGKLVPLLTAEQQRIIDGITKGEKTALIALEALQPDSLREAIFNALDFSNVKTSFDKIFKIMEKTRVSHLRLTACPLTVSQLIKILRNSPDLKELSLKRLPKIDDELWEVLSKYAPNLEKLHLEELPQLCKFKKQHRFPNLQQLSVQSCENLTELNLSTSNLQSLGIRECKSLDVLSVYTQDNLKHLDLTGCSALSSASVKGLVTGALSNLQIVGASEEVNRAIFLNNIEDDSYSAPVRAMCKTLAQQNITEIHPPLIETNINHTRAVTLLAQGLSYSKRLHQISLNRSHITGEGGACIARTVQNLKTVTRFSIGDNQLQDQGAQSFAEMLTANRSMVMFFIQNNKISAAGLNALVAALKSNKLITCVSFEDNTANEDVLANISQMLDVNFAILKLKLPDLPDSKFHHDIQQKLKRNRALQEELFLAIERDDSNKIQELLEKGVSPYADNIKYFTTLHHCALHGKLNALLTLLRYMYLQDISIHIEIKYDELDDAFPTPLELAKTNNHLAIIDVFKKTLSAQENGEDIGPILGVSRTIVTATPSPAKTTISTNGSQHSLPKLHQLARAGNAKEVQRLIDMNGGVVDERDPATNMTALHAAAQAGKLDVVDILSQRGADIFAATHDGETPFDLAYANDHADVTRYLFNLKTIKYEQKMKESGEIIIPTESITREKQIGAGAHGVVYRGTFNSNAVAIKVLQKACKPDDRKQLALEALFLCCLSSPHVISCYGTYLDGENNFAIVTRLMVEDLHHYLHKRPGDKPADIRYQMLTDIAEGLRYIHGCGLIYCDLKPENVFLYPDLRIAIGDLGTVIQRIRHPDAHQSVQVAGVAWAGTYSYMAPEVLASPPKERKNTKPSDVYSFGIMMWEIGAMQIPFGNIIGCELDKSIRKGVRPAPGESKWPAPVKTLMEKCWDKNPAKRPTMFQAVQVLKQAQIPSSTPRAAATAASQPQAAALTQTTLTSHNGSAYKKTGDQKENATVKTLFFVSANGSKKDTEGDTSLSLLSPPPTLPAAVTPDLGVKEREIKRP